VPATGPAFVAATVSEVVAVLRSRDLLALFGRDREREVPVVAAALDAP
jgi:hypothetical protein